MKKLVNKLLNNAEVRILWGFNTQMRTVLKVLSLTIIIVYINFCK